MPFTLKLFFTGLLAFIPVDERDELITNPETDPPAAVWVLAVDADPPNPTYDLYQKPIDPHSVALRFHSVYDRGSRPTVDCIDTVDAPCLGRANDPCVDGLGGVQECLVTLLESEDLRIMGGEESSPLALSVSGAQFNELISLSQVYQSAKLDPLLWTGPVREPVAVRLKLEHGTLERWKWATDTAGNQIEVAFEPPLNWSNRHAASRMVLTIPRLKNYVKFYGSGADLVLGPDPDCERDCVVEVELLNSPYYEAINPCARHKSTSRRHFEILWNLASPIPSPRPAPTVAAEVMGEVRTDRKGETPRPPTADLLCPEVRP